MTNIDFDHPDYYKDINDVFSAFQTFANQVTKGIFAWGDDENLRRLKTDVPIYYYGTMTDDFQARNIKRTTKGSQFDVYYHDEFLGNYHVPLFGKHNVLNSLAVIAVAYFEDVDLDAIKDELLSFKGVKRRFAERKVADMTIIDDYAHHPSEIRATSRCCSSKISWQKSDCRFPATYVYPCDCVNGWFREGFKQRGCGLSDWYFQFSFRESNGKVSSEDLC